MPQADLSLTQDMSGEPIAVTLVEEASAANLVLASLQGTIILPSGDVISPTEYFRTLGFYPDLFPPWRVGHIWMAIIIVNHLDKPLRMVGQTVLHGKQVSYPAASELSGPFHQWQPPLSSPGRAGGRLCPHEIPAKRPDPIRPGTNLVGAGVYYYGQASAASLYGGLGALQFSYSDDDTAPYIGIAWMAPYQGNAPTPGFAVTADMANYNWDLDGFCLATADKAQQVRTDSDSNVTLWATMGNPISGDTWQTAKAFPNGGPTYANGWVLTVSVKPK